MCPPNPRGGPSCPPQPPKLTSPSSCAACTHFWAASCVRNWAKAQPGGGATTRGGQGQEGVCVPQCVSPPLQGTFGALGVGVQDEPDVFEVPELLQRLPQRLLLRLEGEIPEFGGGHNLGGPTGGVPSSLGPDTAARQRGGPAVPPRPGTHRMKTVLPSPTSEGGGCRAPPNRRFWGAAPPERDRAWSGETGAPRDQRGMLPSQENPPNPREPPQKSPQCAPRPQGAPKANGNPP